MTKKFFTKVSPKAAQGIVRLYESQGYEAHATPHSNGDFVVVVVKRDSDVPNKNGFFARSKKRDRTKAVAA